MPVIIAAFDAYPDIDGLRSDLDKLYGAALNKEIMNQCQLPETRLYCGKFNGRWITAALITEAHTESGECITISHVYVREATRRRGVGSQLIEEIISQESREGSAEHGKSTLMARITLDSPEDYAAAEAFLSALGFKSESDHCPQPYDFIYAPSCNPVTPASQKDT